MTRCSASSLEKPRSRNTLPLDGVTFSLLFAGIGPSPVHERWQAILGELQIVFRRLSRALLEGVEDTRLRQTWRCRTPGVPGPYESGSPGRPDQWRASVSVVRIETLLDAPELEARVP